MTGCTNLWTLGRINREWFYGFTKPALQVNKTNVHAKKNIIVFTKMSTYIYGLWVYLSTWQNYMKYEF